MLDIINKQNPEYHLILITIQIMAPIQRHRVRHIDYLITICKKYSQSSKVRSESRNEGMEMERMGICDKFYLFVKILF